MADRVRMRMFARLREQTGTGMIELDLEPGATARSAYAALRARFPALEVDQSRLRVARNQGFCEWDQALSDGDELAFIPPVSGGAAGALLEITPAPLDARRLEAAVANPGAGAICTFTGVVRDNSRGRPVARLEYEAYEEMALAGMGAIAAEIAARWPEARVAMAHRVGRLEIGEASVVVSISCPHRAEAITACRWGIDRLKESVPIWKKEHAEDGEVWIEGADARPI
ncbi:MAG: molybdenum cofactor biosynthesis protein MoaE [Candidatus Dormibacteraceae bacterium]